MDEEQEELPDALEVLCPYCGEPVDIVVDPTGGASQDYVEDCQVCCRPWNVHVEVDAWGRATVRVEGDDAVG